MDQITGVIFTTTFAFSIIRSTTPILFGTLGSCISEKVGMTNIGIDGIMLSSAFAGVIVSAVTGSAWVGLLAGIAVGAAIGFLLAYVNIKLKTDLMLAGVALNLLASSATALLLFIISGDRTVSTKIQSGMLPNISIPGISRIPVLGAIVSGHNVMTYIGIAMIVAVALFLNKTRAGLRIRSIGECDTLVESMGIDTDRYKYLAMGLCGALSGMGGAFLSMGYVSFFTTSLVSGRGTIALAASIMGSASAGISALAALLFGTADALSLAFNSTGIPTQIINMLPYIVTIAALTWQSSRKKHANMRRVLS